MKIPIQSEVSSPIAYKSVRAKPYNDNLSGPDSSFSKELFYFTVVDLSHVFTNAQLFGTTLMLDYRWFRPIKLYPRSICYCARRQHHLRLFEWCSVFCTHLSCYSNSTIFTYYQRQILINVLEASLFVLYIFGKAFFMFECFLLMARLPNCRSTVPIFTCLALQIQMSLLCFSKFVSIRNPYLYGALSVYYRVFLILQLQSVKYWFLEI